MVRIQAEYVMSTATRPVEATRRLQRALPSWILMDDTGREVVRNIDKYSIMRRLKIRACDLRRLDPLLSYPSTILVRENAILLNLEHIKAIITNKEVLVRDPLDDNVIPVVEELRRRLNQVNDNQEEEMEAGDEENAALPFEFRALDVAVEAICSHLSARTIELETAVYPSLDMFTSKFSSRNFVRVRQLETQLTRLTARVQKVRDELETLLDDRDDMSNLYLSRKSASTSLASGPAAANSLSESSGLGSRRISRARIQAVYGDENHVVELEMLLEAYFKKVDGTLNKLLTLREYIDDTQDYINFQLDKRRNTLIKLELFVSSGNFALTVHSLACAILSMSIPYDWNNGHGYLFKWVVILTSAVSGLIFVVIIAYARKKGLVMSGS